MLNRGLDITIDHYDKIGCDTYIYVSEIPERLTVNTVYPEQRDKEILGVNNPDVKKEKYYAWKLLEYALQKSFDANIAEADIIRLDNGRWTSPHFDFSISHSAGVAAVAVSKNKVGIDIELVKPPRSERFAERILSDTELGEYTRTDEDDKNEFLIEKWTRKEAIFKLRNLSSFVPKNIEADNKETVVTSKLIINGRAYIYSAAF